MGIEEWRVIPGHEDYEVSSIGRVRRLTSRTNAKRGQFLKQRRNSKSEHLRVEVWKDGVATTTTVSRLMALAFLGPPPSPEHQAAHNDGDPSRNVLSNVRWATPVSNAQDRFLHGTALIGEDHSQAILTERAVRSIREEREAGATLAALGGAYGVTLHAIWRVVKRKTWRHVE